jgi:hypothetical protein
MEEIDKLSLRGEGENPTAVAAMTTLEGDHKGGRPSNLT